MKNVKKLTTLKVFFQKVIAAWKKILIAAAIVLLLSGLIILLVVNKQTLFYKICFTAFILSLAAMMFLLISTIAVPLLDFKIRGARAWFNWSSSRLLTLGYRLKVWSGLNELKNYSDYRFFNQSDTYLRVQLISNFLSFSNENRRRDALTQFPSPENESISCPLRYNNGTEVEAFTLLVESKTYKKNGEVRVIARWIAKENPSIDEINSAETIELVKGETTLLTYGFNRVKEDGKTEEIEEVLLGITWIGGNL